MMWQEVFLVGNHDLLQVKNKADNVLFGNSETVHFPRGNANPIFASVDTKRFSSSSSNARHYSHMGRMDKETKYITSPPRYDMRKTAIQRVVALVQKQTLNCISRADALPFEFTVHQICRSRAVAE
jgi:hypothetical protein